MLAIEKDNFAKIPIILNQDYLPQGFKFYDPVLLIIETRLNDHIKVQLQFKKDMIMGQLEKSFGNAFRDKLGLRYQSKNIDANQK